MGRVKPQHVDDPAEFGRRIHRLRTGRGLSLREVCFPGCSPSFLSRVEAGRRVPSATVVIELSRRLAVDPEELLGRRLDGRLSEADLMAAEVSARLGEDGAEERLDELLSLARQLRDRDGESRVLEALGLLAIDQRHDARAVELLEAARATDGSRGPRERPALYRALGRAYAGGGDLGHAIAVLQEAFDDARADPPDPALIAQFGTYLANAYTDAGRFTDAVTVLSGVIKHERELAPGNALRLEWALARTYAEDGRLSIAETYTRRVLARLDAVEDERLIGHAHLLLAGVLLDQHRVDDAVPHLDQTETLLNGSEPVGGLRLSLERARAALELGDTDEAEERARQALRRTEATEPGEAGIAYAVLARVEMERGDLDDARFLCRQAIDLMTGTTPPHYLASGYELLSTIEERSGNLQAAIEALRARPARTATDRN